MNKILLLLKASMSYKWQTTMRRRIELAWFDPFCQEDRGGGGCKIKMTDRDDYVRLAIVTAPVGKLTTKVQIRR